MRLNLIKDKYFLFLIGFILVTCLWNLSSIYQQKLMIEESMGSLDQLQSIIESQIKEDPDFFQNPLTASTEDRVSFGKGSYMYSMGANSQILSLLSLDSSWIYHYALIAIIGMGQIYVILIGILVSTIGVGQDNKNGVLQLFIVSSLSFLAVASVFFLANWVYHAVVIQKTEIARLMTKIILEKDIWKPNVGYYFQGTLMSWFFWMTYSVLGYFFGALVGDLTTLLVGSPLLNIFLDPFIRYPITPLYFLHRVVGHFLVLSEGRILYFPPYNGRNLIFLFGSVGLFAAISSIIIQRRKVKVEI